MAGNELGFLKSGPPSPQQQLARQILRGFRSKGHKYVDLRKDGKRYVFFCTLCLAPCYNEKVLGDHLGGNLHRRQYSAAELTLMVKNPWPFDDGVKFFKHSDEHGQEENAPSQGNNDREYIGDLSMVLHDSGSNTDGNLEGVVIGHSGIDSLRAESFCDDLVIRDVMGKEEMCDLRVKFMGYGRISARVLDETNIDNDGIRRMWCEWLGKTGIDNEGIGEFDAKFPLMDFAIVTFAYYYELGKDRLFEGLKTLFLTNGEDSGKDDGFEKRRKKSFSDTEVVGETSSCRCDSSGEGSSSSSLSSALLLHRYDEQIVQSKIMSSKSLRRELRKQQRVASQKTCDICHHKMLPGKDVATLLNLKTERFACFGRNVIGAFHVFHTSCLIHWVLLCEMEMLANPPVQSKGKKKSKKEVNGGTKTSGVKRNHSRKGCDHISSVFCPNCQGTGLKIDGNELEQPQFFISQMFRYKIKLSGAHRAWMKSPETLENCSTGFAFSTQAEGDQGKVIPLKLLPFYRADEEF